PLTMRSVPSFTTYIASALSPSRNRVSPAFNVTVLASRQAARISSSAMSLIMSAWGGWLTLRAQNGASAGGVARTTPFQLKGLYTPGRSNTAHGILGRSGAWNVLATDAERRTRRHSVSHGWFLGLRHCPAGRPVGVLPCATRGLGRNVSRRGTRRSSASD